ncbi:MAG: prepilin peptidase [bacterium]
MIVVAIILSFLLGLAVGSFLNCVIFRLEKGEKFWHGRSHCFSCQKELGFRDLIPIFSFIRQKGRCRFCRKKISWQYPLVELATAVLFSATVLLRLDSGLAIAYGWLFRDWLFIAFLIIIFVYDLKYYLILDKVIVPAIIIALAFNLILGLTWQSLVLGGLIGGVFFLFQFLVSRGRWLGGGDIRLGVLMGAVLGWPGVAIAITLAYFIGSIFSLILLALKKKSWQSQLPLGTFLTIATVITMFWGQEILRWYLNIIGY